MIFFVILGLFGILTGISASLFGFGGGFIVVPLLYHLADKSHHYTMYTAVATSTAIMIVNSLSATYKHNRYGNIIWQNVFPLVMYIAVGAVLGVYTAKFMNDNLIKWCFIIYIAYTILDCLIKDTFIHQTVLPIKVPNKYLSISLGVVIGAVAAILGVGGSVMTVPLMRRLGVKMKNAVAMANPLSFPVGFIGSIGYLILAYYQHVHLGSGYLGFIYLPAFFFLVTGGMIGVQVGANWASKIPDALHAKIYIMLLLAVLISMLM